MIPPSETFVTCPACKYCFLTPESATRQYQREQVYPAVTVEHIRQTLLGRRIKEFSCSNTFSQRVTFKVVTFDCGVAYWSVEGELEGGKAYELIRNAFINGTEAIKHK